MIDLQIAAKWQFKGNSSQRVWKWGNQSIQSAIFGFSPEAEFAKRSMVENYPVLMSLG